MEVKIIMFLLKKLTILLLSSNSNKITKSIDLIETQAYGTSKDLVCKKEEIECNNIIKQYKNVINFDYITKQDIKNIIQIDYKFPIIHSECYYFEVWDLEKQMHCLI